MSLRELAKMSGVSHVAISQIERGERQARPSTLRKLSRALKVEPSDLTKMHRLNDERHLLDSHDTTKPEGGESPERQPSPEAREAKRKEASKQMLSPFFRQHLKRQQERREWREAGKWAEYYVADKVTNELVDMVFGGKLPGIQRAAFLERERIRHEKSYLDAANPSNDPEELNIVALKINSGDSKEVLEATQQALHNARRITAWFEECLRSYQALPEHYYNDPDAATRIEQLRIALAESRLPVKEAAQEWLDWHEEGLDRLEGAIRKARKEGREIEDFIGELAVENLNRSQ